MNDFDFNIGFNFDEEKPKETVKVHRAGKRQLTRKAASEAALESALNWHFENGDCYHCFSFGDVDSLSYLKFVLKQQKIKYLGLSTWCMAGEDVRDLESWYDRGFIETILSAKFLKARTRRRRRLQNSFAKSAAVVSSFSEIIQK